MKILFYTDTPNLGGAEKQMLLLAKYLKFLGHQVSLAYGAYSKIAQLHDEFAKYTEAIYVLPTIHKHDPRHYHRLKTVLKHGDFNLIHLHLWNPGSCRYGFWAATHAGVPIVTTEHDPFSLTRVKKFIKQTCLNLTQVTIAISNENARFLEEYYGIPKEKLHLVSNGVEVERFVQCQEKAALPIQPGDIVVTCIAEMHPRKGHKYLLQAVQKLLIEIPRLQLVLVGTGPSEAELKERYGKESHIHFLGWREDIPQILKASDIFVLPSLKEAFGLVLLEAMASGVLAIGTDSGGTPDIIENGKTGFLVPPGNSEKLVEAIVTILRNPDQKRDIEKAALERVRQEFTAKKMAEKTSEVYDLTLNSFYAS